MVPKSDACLTLRKVSAPVSIRNMRRKETDEIGESQSCFTAAVLSLGILSARFHGAVL